MSKKAKDGHNFKCKLCGHITKSYGAMSAHLNKLHQRNGTGLKENYMEMTDELPKAKKTAGKNSRYKCNHCGHICGTSAGIIPHIKTKHDIQENMKEHYTRIDAPAKRKYNKRPKPDNSKILDILGAGKKDVKFRITVDLEINLSQNTIDILPWQGNTPESK